MSASASYLQDKVNAVQQMQADGSKVMLVGDGVNDALALAVAHTATAMGRSGSDLALKTADVVITSEERSAHIVDVLSAESVR
jgi:cation-transporting P-type ATPase J